MIERHYAPNKPTHLRCYKSLEQLVRSTSTDYGVLSLKSKPSSFSGVWIELPNEPKGYAKELYAALRELDHTPVAKILIEEVPNVTAWEAVRDRLRRAAAQSNT
jgi:L-threonylcarbamoyladenylate synthase